MRERLNRVVDGVEERLCWRFAVHGRADPSYELADGDRGPFDPDRGRRLLRGETFQRLDRSGRPRVYQGLFWRGVAQERAATSAPSETPIPSPAVPSLDEPPSAGGPLHEAELQPAELQPAEQEDEP